MTIRALSKHGYLSVPRRSTAGDGAVEAPSTALVFVLDRGFLTPLKVLWYSFAKLGTVVDLPVIVFTQDQAVADDPVVKACADTIRFIDQEAIQQFSVISGRRVPDRYKLDWIPKYTFLKWAIFSDLGVDQALFVDADIVCLNPVDALLTLDTPGDLLGCPRFMESLFVEEDSKQRSEGVIYRNLRNMVRGRFDAAHNRLNSGVMLIRKALLSDQFRSDLLKFAATKDYVNEQSYLTSYFAGRESPKLSLIPSRYNFGAGALAHLSTIRALMVLSDVSFLHFPGPRKPWLEDKSSYPRLANLLWQRIMQEARAETDLLGARAKTAKADLNAEDM